jgi:hypothetical protein
MENGKLVIDANDDERIFDREHRSFFRIAAGFDYDTRT